MIDDEKQDVVAQKFLTIARDSTVTVVRLTDAVIELAHRRKLLGNPPCSPDKYTIGDEVIWELLLANMHEDLPIVTRDQTFHENVSLLSEEYQARTGSRLILITETFSHGLEAIGARYVAR
jgi:hypothetical protein